MTDGLVLLGLVLLVGVVAFFIRSRRSSDVVSSDHPSFPPRAEEDTRPGEDLERE